MNPSATNNNRLRRSTAGVNKRYDEREYVLVSFPFQNKHSVVPAASINIDPLDKQNGSIKTFGSKKNLRIIGNGSKEMMKERASRFAASAGSEEIELIPEEEEVNEQDVDDDEFTSTKSNRPTKLTKKQVTADEQFDMPSNMTPSNYEAEIVTTLNYERSENEPLPNKTPSANQRLNFDRVYPSKEGPKRSHDNDSNESSVNGSDASADEGEYGLPVVSKSNELRSVFKKTHHRRKKQAIESTADANRACTRCGENEKRIVQLEKRLDQLEKIIPIIKKYRSKKSMALATEANWDSEANRIFEDIEKITGVNHTQITSTLSRPSLVMRELIRKADKIGDKSYFKEHEQKFKDFIQVKCIIDNDGMKAVWKEVTSSIGRQHLDEASNKKKKLAQTTSTIKINSTSTATPQIAENDSQEELVVSTAQPQPSTTTLESI